MHKTLETDISHTLPFQHSLLMCPFIEAFYLNTYMYFFQQK